MSLSLLAAVYRVRKKRGKNLAFPSFLKSNCLWWLMWFRAGALGVFPDPLKSHCLLTNVILYTRFRCVSWYLFQSLRSSSAILVSSPPIYQIYIVGLAKKYWFEEWLNPRCCLIFTATFYFYFRPIILGMARKPSYSSCLRLQVF